MTAKHGAEQVSGVERVVSTAQQARGGKEMGGLVQSSKRGVPKQSDEHLSSFFVMNNEKTNSLSYDIIQY